MRWQKLLAIGWGCWMLVQSAQGQTGIKVRGVVPVNLPIGAAFPVEVPIPSSLSAKSHVSTTVRIGEGPAVEAALQVEPTDEVPGTPRRAWLTWQAEAAQAGKPILVSIYPEKVASQPDACTVRHRESLVEVTSPDGKLILSYRHGRPDPTYKYAVTSYIHPLIGLDGEILTDSNTVDHRHHRGLFWAWVRLHWRERAEAEWWIPQGMTLEAHDLKTTTGPMFGRFDARHYWVYDPSTASQPSEGVAAGERIVDEQVVCRVFKTTPAGRAIDVDLTLTAMQDRVKLGGQTQLNKGYGGLTLRFGADPTHSGKTRSPKMVADGKPIEKDLNHLVARWVDWTAVFDGPDGKPLRQRSGAAVFVHPSHPPLPAAPPEWIARTYGPINVAYPGLEMLAIPKDKPLRLRYRVWIHRGDAEPADVDGHYRAYAADFNWVLDTH